MDQRSYADRLHDRAYALLSGAAQPELFVEFRLARRPGARHHDRDRHRVVDALHAPHGLRLRFGRAHHARCQLRLADPLRSHERRVDVLHRRLSAHFPRPLLRLLQGAARTALVAGRDHPVPHDGLGLHGLCAALGPDELLGRQGDYQHGRRRAAGRRVPDRAVCGAVSRSTTRRSTASTACTICCPSSFSGSSSCTSGPCTRSRRTTRWASI